MNAIIQLSLFVIAFAIYLVNPWIGIVFAVVATIPLFLNKDFAFSWVERIFLITFFFGFVLSFADVSKNSLLAVSLIFGLMQGRLLYRWNGKIFPYFAFISLGLILGYSLLHSSKFLFLFLYLSGIFTAYYIHKNKFIESAEW